MTEKTCDLLIIGGGGSGLVAGARAAMLGKKVIVLEKAGAVGGGTNMASAMRLFNSKWLQKQGCPDREMTSTYMRKRMDEALWRIDKKFAAAAVQGTGLFFDWFMEVAPKEEADKFQMGKSVTDDPDDITYAPELKEFQWGNGMGRIFVSVMKEKLLEYGGEILTKTTTERILMEDGAAVGAIVRQEGAPLCIHSGAVILACGAWIRNPEFLRKHFPELADAQPFMGESAHMNRNYTGDGIALAKDVGALMDEKNLTVRMMGPVAMIRGKVFVSMANGKHAIYVNNRGERFACEGTQGRMGVNNSGILQMEQPNGQLYVIFDENTLRHSIEDPEPAPKSKFDLPFRVEFPRTMEEAHQDIEASIEKNGKMCFKADTLRELAEKLGLDPDALEQTVAAYNRACEAGMDWDCYREPSWLVPLNEGPYYALYPELMTDGAFGGVVIDEHMRVKAAQGGIIPGLYAIGDIASGRFVNMASRKVEIISDMTFAVSSGFLAGTHAAAYITANA